ncbi:MAG: OsmC family protein [Planctomycetaceae bacterium]|nr:OsmC family protein [Planctomycetaceae bacterium]
MTKISCMYNGDGLNLLKHPDNGVEIQTDLPPDNGGKGRYFSPTDLFASSLAACAVTIMGKMAETRGKSIAGTKVDIEKVMAADPRRVAKISLKFTFPASVDETDKQKYLASIHACPVHNSLGKDVEVEILA